MRLDIPTIARFARRFLRWWSGELAALLPARLRRAADRWRRELAIGFDGQRLSAALRRGEQEIALGRVDFDAADPDAAGIALADLLAGRDERYDRCVLRLDEGLLLRRTLALPGAARDDLAEAVGYDLDRITPFGSEDVYFGVDDRGYDPRAGTVEAMVSVVRRSDLDPAIAALRRAGLAPDRIVGAAGKPALRAAPAGDGAPVLWPRATAALAACTLILAVAAAVLPVARIETRIEALEQELDQAREAALAVGRMREEILKVRERRDALIARKRREPMVLALLAELTRAMPDDAFVVSLSYENGEITLSGYARKASEVLGAIETAPHFASARFLSPVTSDRRLERERFSLAARLVSDASGGAPTAAADADLGASLR